MENMVVVWRDGRDVMVSWYHQLLIAHEWNALQVGRSRKELLLKDYDDVYANLPTLIEYAFAKPHSLRTPWVDFIRPFTSPHAPNFSWTDFVHRWHGCKNVVHVRYENMHRATADELQRAVRGLTGKQLSREEATAMVEEFSFERQAGRRMGEENKRSFLRKGVIGDWHNRFSPEAREVFDWYAGEELILLGYERDRSWVNDIGNEKYPNASG